jgi:hypothetical protein
VPIVGRADGLTNSTVTDARLAGKRRQFNPCAGASRHLPRPLTAPLSVSTVKIETVSFRNPAARGHRAG